MAVRDPSIYEIRTDMNYRGLDDMQPIERNILAPEPIIYTRPKARQETRYVNNQEPIVYTRSQQHPEIRYIDKNEPTKNTFCGCCSKRCCIGLFIGLTIGLLVAAAVAVPLGILRVAKYATIGTISSTPNWIGTYQMDNACDSTTCCCFSSQMVLTQTSTNLLQLTGTITGLCNGISSAVTLTQTMPSGFQVLLSWYGQVLRLELGPDSSYISVVNINYPYCSASSLRTSYSSGTIKDTNLYFIIFLLFVIFGVMI